MTTLGDMEEITWAEMIQKSTSTTYTEPRLKNAINEIGRDILDKQVFNELTQTPIQISSLPFVEAVKSFKIIDNPVITSDVTAWDTVISVETAGMAATWAVMIWWETLVYSAMDATSITLDSAVELSYDSGTVLVLLYEMSETFGKPLSLYKVDWISKTYIRWQWEWDSLTIWYNTITIWDKIYIITSENLSWNYYIKYVEKYVGLEDLADETIFPDDIAKSVIPFIAGGKLIKDPDLRQQLLTRGYWNLVIAINKYNNLSGKTKKPRRKRFWFSSIN